MNITLLTVAKAVLILYIIVQVILLFTVGFNSEEQSSHMIPIFLLSFAVYSLEKEEKQKTHKK